MKKIKFVLFLVMGGLLIASCNKQIEDKQTNPNQPASVPPRLLLGTILLDISGTGSQGALSGTGSSEGVNSWDGAHRWNQYHCSNYDYYDNQIYSWTNGNFDPYLVLKNVVQMETEAAKTFPKVNPYEAVGRFVRAYYYYNLTSLFGDVPLDGDLQGVKNMTPTYTTQEKVFQYVLAELDSANTELAGLISGFDINNSLNSAQDLFFGQLGGADELAAWQATVNTFRLRVLVALSNKASDAALNVQGQFAAILADANKYPLIPAPLPGQPVRDLQFIYNPGGANTYSTYPFNPSNFGSVAARFNMAKAYISTMTSLNDPRVFITSEPAWGLVGNDTLAPCKYQYFAGASTGEPLATMYNNANAGLYSFINRKRYYSNFTGDPNVLVGYREMCFNIAEGIARGWAPGGMAAAETWYQNGIIADMAFFGIDVTKNNFTATFLPPSGSSTTDVQNYPFTFNWATYYAQPSVKLSATVNTAVSQIVTQKYIASFQNNGYEPYYNWRRVGVPTFDGGSGVGNNGVVPKRWAYPVNEQAQNSKNYQAALTAQGFSGDDLNQVMWILK